MNDPWDVKSVRQSRQYVSCMKINGVPLLPPVTFIQATYFECRLLESIQEFTKFILLKVKKIIIKLSKECREEMQYYKLLAKEVEKRITILQPYIYDTNTSCSEFDDTDAPELPECEQSYEVCLEEVRAFSPKSIELAVPASPRQGKNVNTNITSNIKVAQIGSPTALVDYPQFFLDMNLNVNTTDTYVSSNAQQVASPPKYVPERDYDCIKTVDKEVITEKDVLFEVKSKKIGRKEKLVGENNFLYAANKEPMSDPLSGAVLPQNGPSSLSSKSFTGSLNNLHSESIKDCQFGGTELTRQRSYTLLKPSPHLLAHLEVHSQNTGVEMTSISMSESLSNITNTPSKKRRSWDLETAKVKWSSMALELNQKNVVKVMSRASVSRNIVKPAPKRISPQCAKSSASNPSNKRNNIVTKPLAKSESSSKPKRALSLVRHNVKDSVSRTDPPSPTVNNKICVSPKRTPTPISESEDPATRVRELYEKIQQQQLVQMASLVEKQKREQILLQQLFEEQNSMFYKQLKTICPTSPIEVKEAWGDQLCDVNRGPVSLSQVINYKSPDPSPYSSPVSATLTDTNNYISHCDNVLKKSRDITGSLKKQQIKSYSQNGTKIRSQKTEPDGSLTRTHSPVQRHSPASRRLNYDTSASSDRDYDQMLTDRTNDTLADLNVTFPSDHSDDVNISIIKNCVNVSQKCGKGMNISHGHSARTNSTIHSRSTDNAIRSMERTITNTVNSMMTRVPKSAVFKNPPTAKQREAATKIVAHVKGYLVRRLMRTDRVQGIVQTIKDALLCALQLHQDREGIRGADVDLHRRLIQQITAACYTLHDTFVASTPAERCAMIAADRGRRRRSLVSRTSNNSFRQTDIMSQSHSGSFPARIKRQPPSPMTQSNYETFSGDKSSPVSRRYMASPRRRPWR